MRAPQLVCATLVLAAVAAADPRPTPAPLVHRRTPAPYPSADMHGAQAAHKRQLFNDDAEKRQFDDIFGIGAAASSRASESSAASVASESSVSASSEALASASSASLASLSSQIAASLSSAGAASQSAADASQSAEASRSAASASRASASASSVSAASAAASLSAAQASASAAGTTLTQTSTLQPTETAPSATGNPDDDGGSNHTPLIIGVSVVGGVILLGAAIFLYMKFGGRRFSDYNEDDADIKWPELKADENSAAMQPLPARRTGGAGFDMGEGSDLGHDNDAHSMTEYGMKAHDSFGGSTAALTGAGAYGAGMSSTGYHDEGAYGAGAHQGNVQGYYDNGYGAYGSQGQAFYAEQQGGAHQGSSVVGYTDPSSAAYSQDPHAAAPYTDSDPYAAAGAAPPNDPYARGPSPPQAAAAYGAPPMHNPY